MTSSQSKAGHDYVPDDFYGSERSTGGGGPIPRNASSSSTGSSGGWRGLLNAGLSLVSRRRGKAGGAAGAAAGTVGGTSSHPTKRGSQLEDVCLVPTAAGKGDKLRKAFGSAGAGAGGSTKFSNLQTCGVYTSANLSASSLEMTGHLLRQSRKVATQWAKEWCVLRDGELLFFASPEAEQKHLSPSVVLELDAFISFRIQPGNNHGKQSNIFDIIGPQRTYTMMTTSPEELESWLSSLHNAQSIRKRAESKSLKFSGALIKLRHGSVKTRWCTLIGRTLFYSKGAGRMPIGSIRLRGVSSALVAASQVDSDSEGEDTVLGPPRHFGLTISTKLRGTHHFLATSAEERDKWVFFMQMASGTLPSNVGTATERLLRTVSSKSNMDEVIGKETLLRAAEDLDQPLTTLLSKSLEQEAVAIWKSVKLYTSVEIESGAYEYHVLLAQGLIEKCLGTPELQNELYCQLIRQTNNTDPESALSIQCWQLLTLCIPIFLPVAFFLRYLELHLKRRAKEQKTTKSGKLAAYALRCLERHVVKGGRKRPPSRAEIISVVLRDPYEYGHPLSCPVQLANGSEFLARRKPLFSNR